jgi:hypothetical protein
MHCCFYFFKTVVFCGSKVPTRVNKEEGCGDFWYIVLLERVAIDFQVRVGVKRWWWRGGTAVEHQQLGPRRKHSKVQRRYRQKVRITERVEGEEGSAKKKRGRKRAGGQDQRRRTEAKGVNRGQEKCTDIMGQRHGSNAQNITKVRTRKVNARNGNLYKNQGVEKD